MTSTSLSHFIIVNGDIPEGVFVSLSIIASTFSEMCHRDTAFTYATVVFREIMLYCLDYRHVYVWSENEKLILSLGMLPEMKTSTFESGDTVFSKLSHT